MFTLKYYDAIKKAQSDTAASPPAPITPFDLDDLGADTTFRRWSSWAFGYLMRAALYLFRRYWPNPRFGRLVIVSRDSDVRQVLAQPDLFEVPYGLEMTELAGGTNFVLGLEGQPHDAQNAVIRSVLQKSDLDRIRQLAAHYSNILIDASGGRIDVMKDLLTRVATETCCAYFGLKTDDPDAFAQWAMSISALLFADPFGNAATRRLALNGSAQIRLVIDRAIARVEQSPETDTVVGRLVAQRRDGAVTDDQIRAILVGLVTGFIPTNTLAAGKILDELLRRRDVFKDAIGRARADDRDGLEAILLEAARLNPALAPGQWRYVREDGVIAHNTPRQRRVRAGDVLMVATMSALRDREVFVSPGVFRADRPNRSSLMFGDGAHACLGMHVAIAQIGEVFRVLLAQPGLRRSAGRDGSIGWVGPFPRRLDMEFEPRLAPASQSMIVICAPLRPRTDREQLRRQIKALGNPARPDIVATLQATGIVHFASLSLVDIGEPEAAAPHLLLELNADGSTAAAIATVAAAAQSWLAPVFAHADASAGTPLVELLNRHVLDLQTRPWNAIGLNFNGTPEFAVADIARQAELADFAEDALEDYLENHACLGSRAMLALDYVRKLIRQDDELKRVIARSDEPRKQQMQALMARGAVFADYLIRPSRRRLAISDWVDRSGTEALASLLSSPTFRWIGAILIAAVLIASQAIYGAIDPFSDDASAGRLALAVVGGLLLVLLKLAVLVGLFLLVLRYYENKDVPDNRDPDLDAVKAIAASENHPGFAQNHITAVTALKPGWFRKLTLALSLWGIKQLVTHWYRPGFVLNMGTIHYAKWFRPPGTDKLIFLANYDGSWESYLEDFVMKAHAGQSAAWSNGVGFPKTRFLILDGAQDGDRFKRWVRRQQRPTQFWYSRFPELTTDQIRRNAVIHDGLARASTDTAARAWLDGFGSMTRPDYSIETPEVQSLVFRGMGEMKYTATALLRLPADRAACTVWLRAMMPERALSSDPAAGVAEPQVGPIAFGDHPFTGTDDDKVASFIAFSAAGLARLGLKRDTPSDGLSTFSGAFNIGMANRANVLRDVGPSVPRSWIWSDAAQDGADIAVDAALFVYGRSPAACRAALDGHAKLLGGRAAFLHIVETEPVTVAANKDREPSLGYEHFGFADGISQPVIKGTQRSAKGAPPRDIVEPGEFILGYRNNQGYYPPSATVASASDPANHLPILPDAFPTRFPNFRSDTPTAAVRDFGRNGTFLAIRHMVQDVEGFAAFTQAKAKELAKYRDLSAVVGENPSADWVAAKLMGRWRDGVPLVDQPNSKSFNTRRQKSRLDQDEPYDRDNDFSYGEDDPQGLHCPFGAHIRRANPRDSLQPGDPTQQQITARHRLLRRGRSYQIPPGAPKASEKGLLFVAVCADVERQFELVQQSWVSSPSFHGLSDEPDPIIASASGDPKEKRVFTIPTPAGPLTLHDMQSYVTVRGGGYFFLPSRSALQYLIDLG
ncbi:MULTISPECIES: cytochrome P450 [Rhodopseudomonas]|uniref:Cytochrome P450 n=1 Tax=Rhodopseudomonas palustris TaxID=1076 RepID=A0A0D7DXG1_RHOPL|nr:MULTISPECIES: cytochrome P450 [Rhodopseudomonas]KIZ33268.1 cytochrome P450 [Rhodopseudomonas palustris]MDF3812934.1 cytochrome P450 [Rhodopseudomonas sp. BAL398]WOK16017.1 cytochrome P450 [Rhodopseudomonas sp. BAL398]